MLMAKAFHQRLQTGDRQFFGIERTRARNVQFVVVPVRSRSEHKGAVAVIRGESNAGEYKAGRKQLQTNPIAAVPGRIKRMNFQTVAVDQPEIEANIPTDSNAVYGASWTQHIGAHPPTTVGRPKAGPWTPESNGNRNFVPKHSAYLAANHAQRILTVANHAQVDHRLPSLASGRSKRPRGRDGSRLTAGREALMGQFTGASAPPSAASDDYRRWRSRKRSEVGDVNHHRRLYALSIRVSAQECVTICNMGRQ